MISRGILLLSHVLTLLIGNCNASFGARYAPSDLGTTLPNFATLQNLHRREYTQDQMDKLKEYEGEPPECMKKCDAQLFEDKDTYTPLCAITDGSTPSEEEPSDDIINSYSCMCTDRKYVEQKFSCLIRECGGNSTGVDIGLNSQYATCMLYADIIYPEPNVFFNELCLLDDMPQGSAPTDVPIMKEVWPDYTFAEEWPEQTATTWAPTATGDQLKEWEDFIRENRNTDPSWTCVAESLEDGGNGASGRQGIMGMAVVVALVTSVAAFF